MKKQLERIRNFSTEFSPDDTKSNFFLGKLIQAATSSKKLQKDILSNTTSIDKAQEDIFFSPKYRNQIFENISENLVWDGHMTE